jgi:aldose sugar dehydrogenase
MLFHKTKSPKLSFTTGYAIIFSFILKIIMYKIIITLFFLPLLFSCQENSHSAENEKAPERSAVKVGLMLDTLSTDLTQPWGMAFLPNGDILITEKGGEIKIFRDGRILEETVQGLPEIIVLGQGGLLDIQLHPDYEKNGWIYFSYSDPGQGRSGNTAVMRAKLQNNQLVEKQKIFRAQPDSERGQHWGSRIQFDRDGYMFISLGDRGLMDRAQELDSHFGTLVRLHDDGRVPQDNPFVGQSNALPEIYSYGHRNIQGMDIHPTTGEIWTHEHGPKGGDELNIAAKGKNYGWPAITYGINYNGTIITEDTAKAGMEQPLLYWTPSIAPCGMTFITGDKYPGWEGDLLVGSLVFRYLHYCQIEDNKVVREEKLFEDIGRVRAVEMGRDGFIYMVTEAPGQLFRIIPVEEAG